MLNKKLFMPNKTTSNILFLGQITFGILDNCFKRVQSLILCNHYFMKYDWFDKTDVQVWMACDYAECLKLKNESRNKRVKFDDL